MLMIMIILFFAFPHSLPGFCSVTEHTDLSVLPPMLNWRQNTVSIHKQFAGKHPEFEMLMMGGVFSSFFFSALFSKQFNRAEKYGKIKVSIETSMKKITSYI